MSEKNTLWFKDAIFYEVYARAFCDSNDDGHGDLAGLTSKLDYLKDLGVDCIWLQPIYPSPLLDDGYDIADYRGVHPDFGTLGDVKHLLAEAHGRGLRVIADLAINHTASAHPWFQAARADRNSPYRDYYVWSDSDEKYAGTRIIFLDTETSNWSWDEQAGQYYWHRFYASQPDLNYDNPAVREEMLNVVRFWLDLGLDGFRVDAVPYLFEREGTSSENLPETHAYLRELRRMVDEHYPGRILLAEANQWPEDLRPYFGDGDPATGSGQAEFHMAFHFPVMPRIFMALAAADPTPIIEIMEATPAIPAEAQWCTFLRNHDELTLEMVTEAERQWMWEVYAPEPRMRLNLGIRRRLAPLLDGDARKIELAHALLFALPGAPIFYYGDEIGMGDNIALDDRNGVRTPMQWDASPNAGFSEAAPEALYAPVVSGTAYDYRQVNVAAQQARPDSLWHALRRLVRARKGQPAFSRGEAHYLRLDSAPILAILRLHEQDGILALHNLSGEAQAVRVDLAALGEAAAAWAGARAEVILGPPEWPDALEAPYPLTLPPFGYAWLKLHRTQTS